MIEVFFFLSKQVDKKVRTYTWRKWFIWCSIRKHLRLDR